MTRATLALIGGCGSSGTTLLPHLLSRHPDVAAGPEFNCFNREDIFDLEGMRRNARRLVDHRCPIRGYAPSPRFMKARAHYGISADTAPGWIRISSSTREFVDHVLSHVRGRLGKPVFVEKTPSNAYTFLRFAHELPDVRRIHVIRDGRDVAVSLGRRGHNLLGHVTP